MITIYNKQVFLFDSYETGKTVKRKERNSKISQ